MASLLYTKLLVYTGKLHELGRKSGELFKQNNPQNSHTVENI